MFSLSLGTSNLPPPCTKREHTSRQSGRLGYAAEVQADTPRAFRPRRSYSDKGVDPILLDKLLATVTSSAERRVRVAQPLRSLGWREPLNPAFRVVRPTTRWILFTPLSDGPSSRYLRFGLPWRYWLIS